MIVLRASEFTVSMCNPRSVIRERGERSIREGWKRRSELAEAFVEGVNSFLGRPIGVT
jgi:hypothetical protein